MKILRSQRMLLRNSSLMNDFSEVQHGLNCLSFAYNGPAGERLKVAMREVQADLPAILENNFNSLRNDFQNETYLISISEHGDLIEGDALEDAHGRLSMWRAYGSRNGVAFVFQNTPFVTESDVLHAYTSPVIYANPDTFVPYFEEVVSSVEQNLDFLKQFGGKTFHDALMLAFRFAVQSTKHPAFREEREWRVIYSPTLLHKDGILTEEQLKRVPTEVLVLNGVPQRVFAIPFKNYEDEGFTGATVPELIDRVLIGPTSDTMAIQHAFVSELTLLGVPDAETKVAWAGVPLRV